MLGRGVGLIALVEQAREAVGLDTMDPEGIRDLADDVCRFVFCGQYRMACALADLEPDYHRETPDDILDRLGRWANWWMFAECVHLAAQIDDFLTTLERGDPRTAALARDCRDELDLLLVLADLCEDSGLTRSAKEACYLYGMVRSMGVDLWATRLENKSRPPGLNEDEDEDDSEME